MSDSTGSKLSIPTMKSIGGSEASAKAGKTENAASAQDMEAPEVIDFSKVKIEPLFEEMVDFDTLLYFHFILGQTNFIVGKPQRRCVLLPSIFTINR